MQLLRLSSVQHFKLVFVQQPMPPQPKNVALLFLHWSSCCAGSSVAWAGWRAGLGYWSGWTLSKIFTFQLETFSLQVSTFAPTGRNCVRMRISSTEWGKAWMCLVALLSQAGLFDLLRYLHAFRFFGFAFQLSQCRREVKFCLRQCKFICRNDCPWQGWMFSYTCNFGHYQQVSWEE